MRSRFLAFVIVVLLAAAAMAQPQPASTVLVTVTNKAGYPPEVELRERLQVTANKQLTKLVSVEPAVDLPVHLAVVIDKSGRPSVVTESEQEAATAFLNRFTRSLDQAFMMNIAEGQPNLLTIRNYADYRAAASRRNNVAGDVVLDGLKAYVDEVEKRYGTKFPARRAVILFSNGGTQIGQDFLPKIREFVIRNRITLFVVNMDWTWRVIGINTAALMKELAEDSGGTFEEPNAVGQQANRAEFADILNHMGAVIRNQFAVTYEPLAPVPKLYPLDVRALDAGLVLHAPRYAVSAKP